MAQEADREEYRIVRQGDLGGGVNNSHNQTLIGANEAADVLNVDFDRDAVTSTGGSIKFNNQTAPGSAIRTRCDPALSPLMAMPIPLGGAGTTGITGTVDVPLRGYGYLPYSKDTDIGGDFTSEGVFLSGTETFHIRRGRSFEINASFMLPPEEKLYTANSKGVNAIAVPNPSGGPNPFDPYNGFDEALDECFCILQKGGDRCSPMSWALAVVNIGNGVGLGGAGALWPNIPAKRPSNYALCWIWYDSAQWGEVSGSTFKYNLANTQHPTSGGGSQYATQAYRAILIHKYVEPGRRYSVAVQLNMDTGTPGNVTTPSNTAWVGDGYFKVWVSEEGEAATSYSYVDNGAVSSGVDVMKGPTDSLSYLCRYGIRYSGRDAMFVGLGQRFVPWAKMGFIPFGADLAPLKSGGFSMVDRTTVDRTTLYGATTATLTVQKNATGDAYLVLGHRFMSVGNTNGGFAPNARNNGTGYNEWEGLGLGATIYNANALRGYRIVAVNGDGWPTYQRGGIITLLDYFEVGASYRINILDGASGRFGLIGPAYPWIQCFRWHQRDLVIGQVRVWGAPRAYSSATLSGSRRLLTLHSSLRLDDRTEPDIENLLAEWRCDDAEGALLRETVVGGYRNGFLCPFGNATTDGGSEGGNMVFLSGEGEALTLDLSDNPVFQREVQRMLADDSQGFGFELSMVQTEAVYAIGQLETLPDQGSGAVNGMRPRLAPDLISWDVKDATVTGTRVTPRPLLTLGYRTLLASTDPIPFRRPMGLGVAVAHASDQENFDQVGVPDLLPWWLSGAAVSTPRYDLTAPWVGRLVTVQVGIQRTTTTDQYDVYIAMTPKDAFLPANGDPGDAEFAYWTDGAIGANYANPSYFTAAHLTIDRKDLARSVLTVGGRWNCLGKPGDTTNLGYTELNARMIVDKVRWFITSPSGALPAASGGILTIRNGKLEGTNALPQRLLTSDDLIQPLGNGVRSANITQGSTSVTPPSQTALYTSEAAANIRAVKGAFLAVSGDEVKIPKVETFGVTKSQWYGVDSVSSGGTSLTLRTAYIEPSRSGAVAGVFRLAGYTAFEDDVRDRPLTLGKGKSYAATGITVADVILTDDLWENLAVPGGGFKLRIYSPLGRSSSAAILPSWTRGLVTERRGPEDGVLGAHGFGDKIYMGVQGAIFEADDRWRARSWTEEIRWGVAFRSKEIASGVLAPLHTDMMRLDDCTSVAFPEAFSDTHVREYDARGYITSLGEYQTIMWLGDPTTDPAENAGTSTGAHAFQMAIRLNRGRPELVLGSTAAYTGATRPEKGLFIATAQQAVPVGEPFHIRFYVWTRLSGTVIGKPWCKINGKGTTVTVNAVDTGVSGANDWMLRSALVSPSAASMRLLIGCGRDSYAAPDADLTFSASTIQGTLKPPQRIAGYLHSFNGELSDIVIERHTASASIQTTAPADFDPNNISYTGTLLMRLLSDGFGVGHRTLDTVTGSYATILSHPFVSVYHEMGVSQKPMHFTEYGSQLYAVNGGKPAVIIDGVGYQAGVVTPISAPSFSIERFPLWKKNVRGSGTDDSYDPIEQAASATATQIYHQNTVGNAFLRSSLDTITAGLMSWDKDDYFHFKGYVRPRSVAGRIQLWRKADGSKAGGPFIDIVDGKLRFGWYDQDLKDEVYVETSGPVFQSNDVHYVHIRKRWPVNDGIETNWQNSIFTDGRIRRMTTSAASGVAVGEFIQDNNDAGATKSGLVIKVSGTEIEYIRIVGDFAAADQIWKHSTNLTTGTTVSGTPYRPMNDVCSIRRFKRNGENASSLNAVVDVGGLLRNRVSLTTSTLTLPAGTSATGLVSAPGATYTGAAAGVVNANNPGGTLYDVGNVFSSDMVGMYWVWGTGATDAIGSVAGKKYRITVVNSATQITVIDEELGTSPSFASTVTAREGGVFTGIELRKSSNFDSSRSPDNSQTVIEMMGSSIQGAVTGEYAAFSGEFYSFGWGVSAGSASGTNAQCFETFNTAIAVNTNDPITTGSDAFKAENYNGANKPDALQYDNGRQVWVTDGRVYAAAFGASSSQPTTALIVSSDPHSPSVAPTCTSNDSIDPQWTYIQQPDQWTVQRQIAVAFYDKKQNIVGNPSPQLTVKALTEDNVNPSGALRVRLTNLPISKADTELWIYESVGDGSSGALFRVAKVENGSAEATIQFNDAETASSGVVLEFTNEMPPRCDIVETSGSRLVYGALEIQPDAFVASKPGFPGNVDFSKVARMNSGFGDRLTAIRDLDGSLVIFKRRCVSSWTFDNLNNPVPLVVTGGVGCVAHLTAQALDGMIVFLSDKGLHIVQRSGVTNLAQPIFVARKLSDFFRDQVDPRQYERAAACLNQGRNQYVLALKLGAETHQNARVSMEVKESGQEVVFGLYRHPNVTALCSVASKEGGTQRLVFGSEEGFALWGDDPRTDQAAIGETADHGTLSFTLGTGSSTSGMVVSGTAPDTSLEGIRGTILRWVGSDGETHEALALSSTGTYVHLADVQSAVPSAAAVKIGTGGFLWESGWIDLGNSERMKGLQYLDLVILPEASGTLKAKVYVLGADNVDPTVPLTAGGDTDTITLSELKAAHRIVFDKIPGTHFKLRLESDPTTTGVSFELASLVWRVSDDDQT